nr:daptide-type RiPP biosynthesis aminotransferase [Sinomonas susongensis]
MHVSFEDGQRRLCAKSGLWNANLGYGNSSIAAAISSEYENASYLPLFRSAHRKAIEASDALLSLSTHRFERVFFSTSGGAANDAVMKLARHYFLLAGQSERKLIVGLSGSYHGLTFGSHALSGDELGQSLYGVDRRNVRHIRFDDGGAELALLMRREGHRVAAVVVEPVLGSGAEVVPEDFIALLLRYRDDYGFLVVADEVATGFGRVDSWFVSDEWPSAPDFIVASKGLTNGTCACAALLIGQRIVSCFDSNTSIFVHGETQAGTPATCAAILATIAEMKRLDHRRLTAQVSSGLEDLMARLEGVAGIAGASGRGGMRGIKLETVGGVPLSPHAVLAVVRHIHRAGAIVHPGPARIQLLPALVYTEENFHELHAAIMAGLDEAQRAGVFT